jgi:hypothetical protein
LLQAGSHFRVSQLGELVKGAERADPAAEDAPEEDA